MKRVNGPLDWPSQEYLNERFRYDGKDLIWKDGKARGKVAGYICTPRKNNSYRTVGLRHNGKFTATLAHRLIWKLKLGYFPEHQIEHVDGNGLNNEWSNLIEVTFSCNQKSRRTNINNTSGRKGVYFHKSTKKWMVSINDGAKPIYKGVYSTKEEAIKVRKEAEKLYNYTTKGE